MRQCRVVLFITIVALASATVAAQDLPQRFDLDLGISQTIATPVPNVIPRIQYQRLVADGVLGVGPVSVSGRFGMQNSDKYAEQQAGFWGGFHATLEGGGVALRTPPFSVRAGRFIHSDMVDSPYSLFVSSAEIPALQLDLLLETDRFFFSSRWLGLNRNSRLPDVIDRGANIRTYGVDLGRLRVGFQDALVYADRYFDLEYLVNPIPGFFLQYVRVAAGSPWSEFGNDNSIMGFFADYTEPRFTAYGQILVDDFNGNAIVNPDSFQNPNKIAWSLGGTIPTRFGVFGLYHAGATKYTFQALGGGRVGTATDTKYGYTYYPAVEYLVGGETRYILPEDNYIGYLHGENNLAFQATWSYLLCPFRAGASLEYTLSGSKSPANPWHEFNFYDEDGQGTRFLNDDRLESRVALQGEAQATFGRWTVFADLTLGVVINELELVDVPPALAGPNNVIRYFSPGETTRVFAGIELGGSVQLGL
jgi:hypothetical protein